MSELWDLLCSAQENIGGIPAKFVEQKKEEIKKRQVMYINVHYYYSKVMYINVHYYMYYSKPLTIFHKIWF